MKDFDSVTKQQWLEKVTKDLKGKPLECLSWEHDGVSYTPFYHRDDGAERGSITTGDNSWLIVERINVSAPKEANKNAHNALMGGANALLFAFEKELDAEGLRSLFEGIHLDWLTLFFEGDVNKAHIITVLSQLGYAVEDLTVFFSSDRTKADVSKVVAAELADLLVQLDSQLSNHRETTRGIYQQLTLGENYFSNIASIRALRILNNILLSAWGVASPFIHIQAVINGQGNEKDIHTSKIANSIQALSATIGGVDSLLITKTNDPNEEFSGRVARNLHHLLEQESYIHQVNDPAAGSYFIEFLTDEIAKKAWTLFQKRMNR